MKKYFFYIIILVALFFGCTNKGTDEPTIPRLTNCDGLITDTISSDNVRLFIPTAFTSNNDGKNDVIKPIGLQNIATINFTLFDIFNTVVFNTTQMGQGFGAAPLSANTYGTYFYRIKATSTNGKKLELCGTVYNLICFPPNLPRTSLIFEDQLTINGFTGITTEVLQNCQ